MKIITLVDNRNHPESLLDLETEHGLSLYIETDDNQKLLYDTGHSDLFLQNAQKLDMDLREVDKVVISHGHYDHLGGLSTFMKLSNDAPVYLEATIFDYEYFSVKNGYKSTNALPQDIMEYRDRFVFIDKNTKLGNVWLITNIRRNFPTPLGNSILYRQNDEKEELDPFDHELLLVVENESGLSVFTGCGHSGILNIISTVQEVIPDKEIKIVYGGFHLLDQKDYVETETHEELTQIAEKMLTLVPEAKFYTGHCTGSNAFQVLKKTLGDRLKSFYVGKKVIL